MGKFETLLGQDYRFLDEQENLGENIHLLVYGGSRAYGTNLPTSDVDIRGIATNSKENILNYNDFEVFTEEKTDTVIYSVNKIFSLLANCNPNTIEILFVRDEDIIYIDKIGKLIRDNRDIFLSNKCIGTFGGYANQQLYRLQQKTLSALSKTEYNEHIAKVIDGMREHLANHYGIDSLTVVNTDNGLEARLDKTVCPVEKLADILNEINNVIRSYNKVSQRNNKAIEHNKIDKHAMHLVRLYLMATELLTTGTVSTYRTKEHDLLMQIRLGKYSENRQMKPQFFELVKKCEEEFDKAKAVSALPDKPDYAKIKQLQQQINLLTINKDPDKKYVFLTLVQGQDSYIVECFESKADAVKEAKKYVNLFGHCNILKREIFKGEKT